MNRALRFVGVLGLSIALLPQPSAAEDKETDYCTRHLRSCVQNCDAFTDTDGSQTWRSLACTTECGIAYVGCLMNRFREG